MRYKDARRADVSEELWNRLQEVNRRRKASSAKFQVELPLDTLSPSERKDLIELARFYRTYPDSPSGLPEDQP